MKKKYVLALVSCFLLNAPAPAATIKGTISCGTWVKERAEHQWGTAVNEFWVLGFLSGLAVAQNRDTLAGIDNDSMFLWIDNFCRANPLERLGFAAEALYTELGKRK